jgi:hypothetical protein
MTLASLQRLIAFNPEELVLHALYRTQDGLNPGTKSRTREVAELARGGLAQALDALDKGRVEVVGTSGFTRREDVLLATTSADADKLVKGA